MKIVVLGGTGLIGSLLVQALRSGGHEVVSASPSTGVDALTGAGLPEAVRDAQTVVDVSNPPSFEDAAVLEFFTTTTRNLLAAEAAAGVKHHVALSIVGASRVPDSGYLRAKATQERLIEEATVPYTIVRATQFFDFVSTIVDVAAVEGVVRLPPARLRPIAAADVVEDLARTAVSAPVDFGPELAGPELIPLDELARRVLAHLHDSREVVTDPTARYFGGVINDMSLTPGHNSSLPATRIAPTTLDDWFAATPN